MSEDAGGLVRKLQVKPGRGGVRLSWVEAQLALALIGEGARAVAALRRIRATGRVLFRP